MSLWTKLVGAATGQRPPEQPKVDVCQRCKSENIIYAPSRVDFQKTVLCLNCGWNSERAHEHR